MQLNTLSRKTKNKKSRSVGRGGTRGKTSGRGTKGQNARAGRKKRPELRDIIKKLPKLRGHGKNRARGVNSSVVKPQVVSLSVLDARFEKGDRVTPEALVLKGIVKKLGGATPAVKILSTGEITKALTITGCLLSKTAKEKIEKAGGKA